MSDMLSYEAVQLRKLLAEEKDTRTDRNGRTQRNGRADTGQYGA